MSYCILRPKNWYFRTVVLEKILECPLDGKEIKPVHPKGNQSWIFTEGTELKLKLQYFGPWWEDLTHWKRPWCWARLKSGGEGGVRGWDGWMASLTQWTWVWPSSGRQWRTGKPGMLQSMGLQRVRYDLATQQQQQMDVSVRNRRSLIQRDGTYSWMYPISLSPLSKILETPTTPSNVFMLALVRKSFVSICLCI